MSYTTPPSGYLVPEQPGSPARPGTVSLASTLLYLLAFLGVISAGLLPPSHPFFRKPEATWTPPTYPTA